MDEAAPTKAIDDDDGGEATVSNPYIMNRTRISCINIKCQTRHPTSPPSLERAVAEITKGWNGYGNMVEWGSSIGELK